MKNNYDYVIIGSGPAGHTSAIKAAQLGLKVAVVEKDKNMFGGVCLNEGCIPAKSLINSAKIFDSIKKMPNLYGFKEQSSEIDMPGIVKKSRQASEKLQKGLAFLFKKNGIDRIHGKAEFIDGNTVRVSGTEGAELSVKAEKFLVATGSSPRVLPDMPFDGRKIITSSQGIRQENVPRKVLIVGGGAIGTEFASFFNVLGSEVVIVEVEDLLLPIEDNEVSRCLQSVFNRKGIKVLTSSRIAGVSIEGDTVNVTVEGRGGISKEGSDVILVSVGRMPASSDIGLGNVGVDVDDKGYIPVDGMMRTNTKNIYAAGDVVRSPMLAHVASAEGEVAAEDAAGGSPAEIDYTCVPSVVYAGLQTASVGLSEKDAKGTGINYKTGKQFFRANGRAVANSQTEGFIKVMADVKTKRIIGVHIVGYEAAELIHEFVVAKKRGLTVDDVAGTIHAHPTFSETAVDACKSVFGKPIHG